MATRTTVTLVDDLDGGTAEETVGFGLDGAAYEIDLSAANAGELRSALERYVAAARRTGGRRSVGADTAPSGSAARASASSSSASSSSSQPGDPGLGERERRRAVLPRPHPRLGGGGLRGG
jgi:hypothetical protein